MKVLLVKLSSLGDVVHAMPAVQDIRRALPEARIDWVVESGFAPLVQRCEGVNRVILCDLRRWRGAPLAQGTRAQWRVFRSQLRQEAYDAVIDLQGLSKSALVAWMARLSASGRRYAMANRTAGSSYEAPTRWVADVALVIDPHTAAVERSRLVCAGALGYPLAPAGVQFGLRAVSRHGGSTPALGCVAFVHGSSRRDKCWPMAHWLALGRRLIDAGYSIGLPHGSQAELQDSQTMADALGSQAQVWPRTDLGLLADRLAECVGVIGVDSGLSHIAVALNLPHVQLYNFDTAWRTGPVGVAHQVSVYAPSTPSVDEVWHAWARVVGGA